MSRLIKAAHDVYDRDAAILYIDGKIYEGQTHAKAIQQYLLETNGKKLSGDLRYRSIVYYNLANEQNLPLAFAHRVESEIFIEPESLENIDIDTVANALKSRYPNYNIYEDNEDLSPEYDDYKLLAFIKKFKKIASKIEARHDIQERDKAIIYVNGELYEGQTHSAAIQNYLKDHENIDPDEDAFYRSEIDTDEFDSLAFAHLVDEILSYDVYVDVNSVKNVDIKKVVKAFQKLFPREKVIYDGRMAEPVDDNAFYGVYINGEIYEDESYELALKNYFDDKDIKINKGETCLDKALKENYEIGCALLPKVKIKVKAIYIETDYMENVTLSEVTNAIKNKYPDYAIYEDDKSKSPFDSDYKLIAANKKINKENIKMKRLIRESRLEIEQGDYVDFGAYGKLYVSNPDHSEKYYWVTDEEKDRTDKHASGWSILKDLAEKIIQSYNNYEDEEDEN